LAQLIFSKRSDRELPLDTEPEKVRVTLKKDKTYDEHEKYVADGTVQPVLNLGVTAARIRLSCCRTTTWLPSAFG
jgi:hypothetical protein